MSLRGYVYHITSADNFALICETRRLESAKALIKKADQPDSLRERRDASQLIDIATKQVRLQSQSPLHAGNIAFEGGWNFQDLLDRLNSLVFLWPGNEAGPIDYGRRHFESPSWNGTARKVLRIHTQDLLNANAHIHPLFCKFNSGSPRCSPTTGKSPRGPKTFISETDCDFRACDVKEVVFEGAIHLPPSTTYGDRTTEPWLPLLKASEA